MAVKTISILGCGWYGSALGASLVEDGFKVKGSTTSKEKSGELSKCGIVPFRIRVEDDQELTEAGFFDCGLVVVSIPPKRKAGEAAAYPDKVNRVKKLLIEHGIKKVIFISSTSVYGDHNREFNENDSPEPDSESGKAILAAEKLLTDQEQFDVCVIRFGGLFGPGRDPAEFFAGKKGIANGEAPVNMIHLSHCIGVTKAVIEKNAFSYVFNACAEEHPSKMDFYTTAALKSGLEPPEFIEELKAWKIVSSINLRPVLQYRISMSQ